MGGKTLVIGIKILDIVDFKDQARQPMTFRMSHQVTRGMASKWETNT